MFLRWEIVSTSPNYEGGGPTLLIQYIRCHPPYWRPLLHPQPEDKPCHGDRNPLIMGLLSISTKKDVYETAILFRLFKIIWMIFMRHDTSDMLIKEGNTNLTFFNNNSITDELISGTKATLLSLNNRILKWLMVTDLQKIYMCYGNFFAARKTKHRMQKAEIQIPHFDYNN